MYVVPERNGKLLFLAPTVSQLNVLGGHKQFGDCRTRHLGIICATIWEVQFLTFDLFGCIIDKQQVGIKSVCTEERGEKL